jgi:hypothetical protein
MQFLDKMNKINDLYQKANILKDVSKMSEIALGAYEIAIKQFPKEYQSFLEKFNADKDLIEFKNSTKSLFLYIQSVSIEPENFKIILTKNNKDIIIPFFNINKYIETKNLSNDLDRFLLTILFIDESNFNAFQLFSALELLKSVKTQ